MGRDLMRYKVLREDTGWLISSFDSLSQAKQHAKNLVNRTENEYYVFDSVGIRAWRLSNEGKWQKVDMT